MVFQVVEDREVLVLVVAFVAFLAVFRCRKNLGPEWPWALFSVSALLLALLATNIEEMVSPELERIINVVEHLAYLTHTGLLVLFVTRMRRRSLAS